jgi:hypothetical protein
VIAMSNSNQREFFFPYALPKAKWVEASQVAEWATWREAVLWCWENRPEQSMQKNGDQSTFRHYCEKEYSLRVHAPHVSRWLNRDTDAPMDLPPDFVSAFETFTGWHGLTQFFNRKAKTTCLEEMQARFAA